MTAKPKKQNGFTLLEVMVTLLIMSLGLLGLAGFVINSVKYSKSAYTTSIASALASDIVDRMRANSGAALGANPSPYNLTLAATPTTATIAQQDLTAWRASLAAALPSGTGSVCVITQADGVTPCAPCTPVPPSIACVSGLVTVVTIQWDDSQVVNGSATRTFRLDTML